MLLYFVIYTACCKFSIVKNYALFWVIFVNLNPGGVKQMTFCKSAFREGPVPGRSVGDQSLVAVRRSSPTQRSQEHFKLIGGQILLSTKRH